MKRSTHYSAGYDIPSNESYTLKPGTRHAFSTNVYTKDMMKHNQYGKIEARSSLAFKYGIIVLAGVIDADYENEVKVILFNSGDKELVVSKGDRIAQLILHEYHTFDGESTDQVKRNGGFGSTDK